MTVQAVPIPVADGGTGATTSTGTGAVVLQSSPSITTPTIASFTNAAHDHDDAAGGGQLNATNVFSAGTVPTARLGTGTANSTTFLRGDQTYAAAGVNAKILGVTFTNAAGSQAVTGAGFAPKAIVVIGRVAAGDPSIGLGRTSTERGRVTVGPGVGTDSQTQLFHSEDATPDGLFADLTSLDADGFTVSKTQVGFGKAFVATVLCLG